MQKITPFLWFNNNAEEAINFYTSVYLCALRVSVVINIQRFFKLYHYREPQR
jgi:predicted 3-demethylubiquinone-9 3-methyltransferase (glyoxalase superfamily)